MISDPVRTLVIGASYRLLPAPKIAASGHPVTVVGYTDEISAIASDIVRIDFGKSVRRQNYWSQEWPKLRECSAHLIGVIMRRVFCDASVAFRRSFV